MKTLEKQARTLLREGIYDPQEMFAILYSRNPVHYVKVREAIHKVKVV